MTTSTISNTGLEYECDHGHVVGSVRPLNKCPAYVKGQACDAVLRAVGEGSQAENRRLKELRAAKEQGR